MRDQLIVFFMRADPKPNDFVITEDSDRSMIAIDSNGVNRLLGMDLLEVQTGMVRILGEELVCFSGSLLDRLRQILERFSETLCRVRGHYNLSGSSGCVRPLRCSASASSANLASWSRDSPNAFSQRCSEASSSSIQAARASCSCLGSLEISANAFSRSFVMVHLSIRFSLSVSRTMPLLYS